MRKRELKRRIKKLERRVAELEAAALAGTNVPYSVVTWTPPLNGIPFTYTQHVPMTHLSAGTEH